MLEHLKEVTRALLQTPLVRAKCRTNRWRVAFFERYSLAGNIRSRCLDIGSGPIPRNPLKASSIIGADIRSSATVVQCDLSAGRLPFTDGSFEAITAFDVLEHIPRLLPRLGESQGVRFPFVELMSEVCRCLVPGGIFISSTPCYPWSVALQDPTHVNIMTEETIPKYFCGESPWAQMYGFRGRFNMLEDAWINSHYLAAIQRK